jgi:predicted phage terminase large subunit-like protein
MGYPIINRKDNTVYTRDEVLKTALENPYAAIVSLGGLTLFEFVQCFWNEVSDDELKINWHIPYLCGQLEEIAERVGKKEKKLYDLITNIPPGTTKTIICSVMFPVWCWTKWYWMKFITGSYSSDLSLESAEKSRDIIRSDKFKLLFPDIIIKEDKDTKSNYRIAFKIRDYKGKANRTVLGGGRYSTSVGGTIMGFHGHINIWDDPLNPKQAVSEALLKIANDWIDQSASTRKIDKEVSVTILVMQRLHNNDPTGHLLEKIKEGKQIKHICLPGEIVNYRDRVSPIELIENYSEEGLLDPVRLSTAALKELEADLGQYGYAGQIGQSPTPPGGGMFKVDNFQIIDHLPNSSHLMQMMRYWDKAGTEGGGKRTAGVKIVKLTNGKYIVVDVRKGQWEAEKRERIIKQTAQADERDCEIGIEQEPGPIWEDEKVQMANGVLKKLKDVKKGDFVINWKGKSTKVLEIYQQGTLPILKITTDSGREIHTAYNHPFLTPNGWVNADHLQIDDNLALKTDIQIKITSFPSIEECRLAGYFVGDGCCTWTKNKEITCNSNIVCSDVLEGKDIIYCAEKLGFKVHVGGSKGWTYYISGGIKDWLKNRGLAGKNTFQKRIPEWVLKADNVCVANFLGAYLACDGSVMNTKHHPCVEYYSTNLDLLKDTQSTLLRFGIYTMLRKRNYKDEFQKTRHFCYRITTRRSDGSMGRFAKYIPVYGIKGEKLKIFNHLNFDQPYISDPIVSIEKMDKMLCRCIAVKDGESFLVNDVVVHNSGGKESAEATMRNLAGFVVHKDLPKGDKIYRADPFSVQVNEGNVMLLRGDWNHDFIEELRFFPFGNFKDQVDAASAAFNLLATKKIAGRIT